MDRRRQVRWLARRRASGLQRSKELVRRMFSMRAHGGDQPAPKLRLPILVVRMRGGIHPKIHPDAGRPGIQPGLPIGDVLFQDRGDLYRKIQPHHRVRAVQVVREPRKRGVPGRILQQGVDAPGEDRAGERRFRLDRLHDPADLAPQPLREIHEVDVSADALIIGDGQGERAAHGSARNDDLMRHERRSRCAAQLRNHGIAEDFEAVRELDAEHSERGTFKAETPHCCTSILHVSETEARTSTGCYWGHPRQPWLTCGLNSPAIRLTHATPSVFHQYHIGRAHRSS